MKEVREAVAKAAERRDQLGARTLLFVDEIHRFNKAQQDALLPHVEAGTVTLIGATTENPSLRRGRRAAVALPQSCVLRARSTEDGAARGWSTRALADASAAWAAALGRHDRVRDAGRARQAAAATRAAR